MDVNEIAIDATHLTYTFPGTEKVGLADISIQIPWGATTLLVGPNGAGKSTLLKILAGKTLTRAGSVKVGNHDPFRAGSEAQGITTYLGTEWASNPVVRRDIPVALLISSMGGDYYSERREELVKLLDVDITWRMNNVSDGERRRVQLVMGLLKPWRLLLLDEVTVDLDVLVRSELLRYLKRECQERNATVVYATHIFDGLGDWASNVIHISGGGMKDDLKMADIHYNQQDQAVVKKEREYNLKFVKSLHPLALNWLIEDLQERGDREEELNRPKWEDLKKKLEGLFYDRDEKITDYFKTTRKI